MGHKLILSKNELANAGLGIDQILTVAVLLISQVRFLVIYELLYVYQGGHSCELERVL
ncbi:hypothetical protein VYA_12630 [Vibrio alfacsensis]|nr:hypothetical protein VYA_12630 [Vibrio alfacsensis]